MTVRQYLAWEDVAAALTYLGDELGKHEERGQNDGSCAVYQRAIGGEEAVRRNDSWCLYLALWALWEVLGRSRPALAQIVPTITGSCEDFRRAARVTGQLVTSGAPLPGDIGLVIRTADNHAHHAFTVSKGTSTLEGNSNDTGGSNGDGAYMRTSRFSAADPCMKASGRNRYEFVRLTDPADPCPAWLL